MINKYPYTLRIKQPNLCDILENVAKNKTFTMKTNRDILKALGKEIKPVRKDAIFIGPDSRYYESNISLKNNFKIEIKPLKKGKEFIFRL